MPSPGPDSNACNKIKRKVQKRKRRGPPPSVCSIASKQERSMRFIPAIVACGVLAATGLSPVNAADISGAGATFPYPIYAKWADAYKKETGSSLNYQSIGSGGGIKQIQAKTVAFGATDMPLGGPELNKDGLLQFPMVL